MKISEGKIKTLNGKITYEKLKKHINEKDGVERRAKEYVKRYNAENAVKTVNGVKGKIIEKHYGTRKPREWEKDDKKTVKYTGNETCILFDNTENVLVKNVKIEKRIIYEKHSEESDKEYRKIFGKFANVKMELEKMELGKIPEKIKFEGEEINRNDLYKIMLGKNVKAYKIISAEIK